jgi:hypothetical protein
MSYRPADDASYSRCASDHHDVAVFSALFSEFFETDTLDGSDVVNNQRHGDTNGGGHQS